MNTCNCEYCGENYEENKSTAVNQTAYCTAICERDDEFEKNPDSF